MCAVPASFICNRKQHVSTVLHALNLPLHYSQLRWIDQIVGRVNCEQWGFDFFERWRWIVFTRRVEVVEHVVGIGSHDTALHTLFVEFIGGITSRRLLLPLQRRTSHQ